MKDKTIEEFVTENRDVLIAIYFSKNEFDSEIYSENFIFFMSIAGFLEQDEFGKYSFTDKFHKFVLDQYGHGRVGTGEPVISTGSVGTPVRWV